MLINELAKEIHENAVAHGWWDEERDPAEIIALIHSEWSEALEEARAGRPLAYIDAPVWYSGSPNFWRIERGADGLYIHDGKVYYGKPEGIAVELIDGCIRILDWLGKLDINCEEKDGSLSTVEKLYSENNVGKVPDSVSELIAWLHLYTSNAMSAFPIVGVGTMSLLEAVALAMSWVKWQGIDPLALMMEKHEYNKTRPYKHGKKF